MKKSDKKYIRELSKKLKKKGGLYDEEKPKIKKKQLYMITEANFEYHLIEMILMLNDIDETKIMVANRYGTIINDFGFDKRFKELSCFDWKKEYPINSPEYRGKFATLLLFWMLDNTEDLIDSVYEYYPEKKKGSIKRSVLKTVITRIDLFIVNFLAKDTIYSDTMYDVLDLTILASGNDKIAKIMKNYQTQRAFIKDSLESEEYDDSLIWHNVIRLAYMMATNNRNFNKLPDYDAKIDLSNPDVIKDSIGRLGLAICIQRNNHKRKPEIYKIFSKANPLILSSFDDVNEHIELKVGTKALMFLAFIVNDESFSNFLLDYM